MTTSPQDPFGTPREGEGQPSDPPHWDQPHSFGQSQTGQSQPGQSQPGQSPYAQQEPGQSQPGQSPYAQQQPGQPFGQWPGSPSYGPPSYGAQPGYGAPQVWHGPTQTESKAIIALVCAIASWVVFPVLPAIAGLMIANTARSEISRSGGRLTGEGLVTAAKVISWLNIGLAVLGVLLLVLALTVFSVSASDVQVS